MPNYLYKCPICKDEVEETRKVEDRNEPLPCYYCDNTPMVRKMGTAGFTLQGPGWHKTDYNKTGRKKGM